MATEGFLADERFDDEEEEDLFIDMDMWLAACDVHDDQPWKHPLLYKQA